MLFHRISRLAHPGVLQPWITRHDHRPIRMPEMVCRPRSPAQNQRVKSGGAERHDASSMNKPMKQMSRMVREWSPCSRQHGAP